MAFDALGIMPESLGALLVGVAVLSAALLVAYPYAFANRGASRIAQLQRNQSEREAVRLRERARSEPNAPSLTTAPRRLFDEAVKRVKNPENAPQMRETARMLRTAGFRGERPVVVFYLTQVALPLALTGLVASWLNLVMAEPPDAITQLAAIAAAVTGGAVAPRLYVKNALTKRRQAILKSWPDALDLMLICIEAGMSIEVTMQKVADEMVGTCDPLAEELNLTVAELAYLQDRSQALRNLGDRCGLYSMRSVVAAMIQSEKHGTSLSTTLRVISGEQREARLMEAEKKAAALPPKLTVPMILFFLPVLFIVIMAPAIIKIIAM
jgi:tight adherence protein C